MSVFKLIPGVQSYDWGKIGEDSVVAQYASVSSGFSLDQEKPYAEVPRIVFVSWMIDIIPNLALDGNPSILSLKTRRLW